MRQMVTDQWLEEIHRRIGDGDPTAPADLAENMLKSIKAILAKKWPSLPNQDLLDDAVVDAFISYIKRPDQYHPEKRSLKGYLVMSAEGDLKNLLESHKRRNTREISATDVELLDSERKFDIENIGDPRQLDSAARKIELDERLDGLRNIFPDSNDLEAAMLILGGERSTTVFAEAMGIDNLPLDQLRQEVKRHKDRLKKRLKRWKGRNS